LADRDRTKVDGSWSSKSLIGEEGKTGEGPYGGTTEKRGEGCGHFTGSWVNEKRRGDGRALKTQPRTLKGERNTPGTDLMVHRVRNEDVNAKATIRVAKLLRT
jgi:hypothetical protein